jgi:D-psicose/D-tagatose/L-ribulose 3-epimerase
MTRREAVLALAAAPGIAAPRPFRLAVCNETFAGAAFADACRLALATGYTGIEIMPSTLAPDPAAIPADRRAELRRIMQASGVVFTGMHAVVSAPPGLHLTTPDDALRKGSWDYFRRMVDLCADLGPDGYIVLGSAGQRSAGKGASAGDAVRRLRDGLAGCAPHARDRGVLLLAEPLAPHLCNVLTSLGEAVDLVRSIDHPFVRTMFDTHNAVSETEPHNALIRRHAPYIRHVHVNEMDGRQPGTGSYDFARVLRTLREIRYDGWISLEVFQFKPSGEQVARESAAYLRRLEAAGGS